MPRTHRVDPKVWEETREWSRKIIQMEMLKRDLTYGALTKMLNDAGIEENERNLRNKIARGEFSAPFMLMCLSVMGAKGYENGALITKDFLIEQQERKKASSRKSK